MRRHGLPTVAERPGGGPYTPVIDPLVLDRAADRYRKGKRNLEALAAHYEVKFEGDAHTAGADAQAALDVALAIAGKYPELQVPGGFCTAGRPHGTPGGPPASRTTCGSRNPDAVISRAWPIVPFQAGAVSG